MALAERMKETVCELDAISALIDEWNRTPEHNHGTRARICVEMDSMFVYRSGWSRKHQPSYKYAITKGLVKSKLGLNQWVGGHEPPDMRSLQAKIAEARTWLHEWCVHNKIGYWDEYNAGGYLISLMNDGKGQQEALNMAKMSVPIGQ